MNINLINKTFKSIILAHLIALASYGINANASPIQVADTIVTNAKISTLNPEQPNATTVAIKNGKFLAVGDKDVLEKYKGNSTKIINAEQRRMIPGLNDSHMHLISYGATFNREIRWDGIPSLQIALEKIQTQAKRTPKGQWVSVLGGWTTEQFKEKRLPTPAELDKYAPNTPVMVTHLWDRAILNKQGLKQLSINRNTPNPAGGIIEKDAQGEPTGVIIAVDDWFVILDLIAKLPTPENLAEKRSSTQKYMQVLNQYGITSIIDGGAGNYPDNYAAIISLAKENKLTVRVSGTLYPPKDNEMATFDNWLQTVNITNTDQYPLFRIIGAGEILSYASFDMTNFEQAEPQLKNLEVTLKPILSKVIQKGWSFRLHATYNETITRFLNVIEEINTQTPIKGRWSIEHADTITEENMQRIKKLGGGIGVQSRLLFQADAFNKNYSQTNRKDVEPVKRMLEIGLPVGFGTDSMRIASYNPWLTPYLFVSGKNLTGAPLLPQNQKISRLEALRLNTNGSAWFSNEETVKGEIKPNMLADFTLLSDDYFTISEDKIPNIRSVLTVVDGKPVYGTGKYSSLSSSKLTILPTWSTYAEK